MMLPRPPRPDGTARRRDASRCSSTPASWHTRATRRSPAPSATPASRRVTAAAVRDRDPAKVDCSICHAEVVDSTGRASTASSTPRAVPTRPTAPTATAPTASRATSTRLADVRENIPALCGTLPPHGAEGGRALQGHASTQIVEHYAESIHGKGLLESGLVVTATCADCHTAARRAAGERSRARASTRRTSPAPAPSATAASTSSSTQSIHSPLVAQDEGQAAGLHATAIRAHTITRTDRTELQAQRSSTSAASCHAELAETYFDTYHGKVSKLGYIEDREVLRLPRRARHPAGVATPTRTCRRAEHRGDLRQCHPGSQPPLRRLPHPRHAPRPEEVPGPVL